MATRGRARARRYTWREAAKHTLLAYQKATQDEGDAELLRAL